MNKCCLCHKPYKGFGNNAEPVRKGYCCDACNEMIVIPERIYRFYKKKLRTEK